MENKNNVENEAVKKPEHSEKEKLEKGNVNNNDEHKKIKVSLHKRDKKEELKTLKQEYEAKLAEAHEQISNLKAKILDLEIDQAKNIDDFKAKAQDFANKAQEEITRHKNEINQQMDIEKNNLQKYGSQKLLEAIMEPILNIEIAVQSGKANPATNAYVVGFEMLLTQFYNELNDFGVSKISPQIGEEFNPNLHYAISTQAIEPEKKQKIIEIKKDGFKLHDRILKPATVVIGE